jgi:hypothetical protein
MTEEYRMSRTLRLPLAAVACVAALGCQAAGSAGHENVVLDLWEQNRTAFGVYVPNEQPLTQEERRNGVRRAPVYTTAGGKALAQNPLYDFVFLNLEGAYDVEAVRAIAEGLRGPGAVSRKTLLVRIPPIARDGADTTRARVKAVLELGADGVVLPHVRGVEEARLAVSFFAEAGADVWSPFNRGGETIAMIMVEDPESLDHVAEIAAVPGYSVLACGIGSLTRAMAGDREAAEAGNMRVLAESKRVGLADMITANAGDVERRVREGFLALLMQGPTADEVITLGRAAAGRTD